MSSSGYGHHSGLDDLGHVDPKAGAQREPKHKFEDEVSDNDDFLPDVRVAINEVESNGKYNR